ncbi:unnamed protein product [Penicillium roqueforti FM164]|uniref:Genomic scaffold, ProqFM164S02 n=1 Tax=Penicillium roqueforti (strain FM164) TaxID=1365484 RepID=W6QSG3_PENRF|nr:unnamed protein product [Penicillium roqueforti FM164]
MDFLSTSLGRDTNVAISNIYIASRELLNDISSSDLGDTRIKVDELGSKPAAYVIGKSMPAKKYNRYPISESYMVISQEKDRAAVYNNKGELQRCDTESLSNDPYGPDDTDYVGESGKDIYRNSIPFYRLKRVRRPTVQLKPRPPRQNTKRLLVDEAVQFKVAVDQSSPISLYNIETIPIRGFLTR